MTADGSPPGDLLRGFYRHPTRTTRRAVIGSKFHLVSSFTRTIVHSSSRGASHIAKITAELLALAY